MEELEELARCCRSPSAGEAQQGELRAQLLAFEGFGPYAVRVEAGERRREKRMGREEEGGESRGGKGGGDRMKED